MTKCRGPIAVGSLVLNHGHERFLAIGSLFEPREALFGDKVITVSFVPLSRVIHLDEVGIVVSSLAGEDFPVIKADGVRVEMPFSDHGGGVACIAEEVWEGLLEAVEEGGVVIDKAIHMRMLTGEDAGARRTADGIGAIGAVKAHAFFGDTVDARGGGDFVKESSGIA